MNELKAKMGSATWRKYKDRTVEVDGEEVAIVIRRTPVGVSPQVLNEARLAGDITEDGRPTDAAGAVRLLARVAATVIFEPGAVRPLFDRNNQEDLAVIMNAPWLDEVKDDIMAAFGSAGVLLEKMKGNSEATPTEQ